MTGRRATLAAVACGLAVVSGLNGCLTVSKAYPDKTYYVLTAARPGPDPVSADKTVLKIKRFRALPRFEGRGLVYRTSDYHYESDYYHEWFLAPDAMLTQQAHDWLAGAGLFRHVLASASTVEETHLLEGTVTALYGDYRDRASPRAVLGLQVLLIAGDGDPTVLMQRDYQEAAEVAALTPDALMRGWETALQRILTGVEGDLKTLLRRTRPADGHPGEQAAGRPPDPRPEAGVR